MSGSGEERAIGYTTREAELAQELLRLSRTLLAADEIEEVLEAVLVAVREQIGYRTVWIYEFPVGGREFVVRTWARGEQASALPARIPAGGDALIAEVHEGTRPAVVVEDARTDPRTNKEVVRAMGICTVVAVGMDLSQRRRGALSTGSFGEEGVRVPSPAELGFLCTVGSYAALALDRLRVLEDRAALTQRLMVTQKLGALGRAAAGLAHDLNNVMFALQGSAQLLELEEDPAERATLLEVLQTSVRQGVALTHRLVSLTQVGPEPRPGPLDVNLVVEEASPVLRRLGGASLALELELAPELGEVRADRGHVEQVLLNLVVNARDAVGEEGRIRVRTARLDDPPLPAVPAGAWVLLEVEDDGPGIPLELQERVFEPFFTTRGEAGGHGLGLATCAELVERAGGVIRLESTPGERTRVQVYLPRLA